MKRIAIEEERPKFHDPDHNSDRVLLRYHGGKSRIAGWVLDHFSSHQRYVEAFGGGASVLINKPLVKGIDEVYNDIDGNVVQLFEVLRKAKTAQAFVHAMLLTPYGRREWKNAYEDVANQDDIEEARRLCVRVMMGWGSKGLNKKASVVFRKDDKSSGYGNDWKNYVDELPKVIARLRSVNIECEPAVDLINRMDSKGTLFYLDPPYLLEGGDKTYTHDMDYKAHETLLHEIRKLKGKVILSGYPTELYEDRLKGWWVAERTNYTDSHAKRMDCLWLNDAAAMGTFVAGENAKKLERI